MARILVLLLSITFLAASTLDGQGRRRGGSRGSMPELKNFTFQAESFDSESLEQPAEYGIYLPKGYADKKNAKKTYPLVIWLHGMWEDHQRFGVRGGAAVLDQLRGTGDIPEMVFVTPNGGRSFFYVNGKKSGKYEDLIVRDLLGHLEKTYRVSKERGERAIMGVSMGGYGALKIALRHPRLFGAVAAHSAAIFPPDPNNLPPRYKKALDSWGQRLGLGKIYGDPLDIEIWQANNPLHLASTLVAKDLDGLKIYFDCGSADRYNFAGPNEQLHALMKKRELKHTWQLVKGGNHGWGSGYNQKQLPSSLTFVANEMTAARGRAGLQGVLMPGKKNGDDK